MKGYKVGVRFLGSACAVLVLAAVLAAWIYRPDLAIRAGTASTSQTLCGEIFVSGLDVSRVFAEEIQPRRGMQILLKRLRYTVDSQRQHVVTTWAGHFASIATYRNGYGCTLGDAKTDPRGVGAGPEEKGRTKVGEADVIVQRQGPERVAAERSECDGYLEGRKRNARESRTWPRTYHRCEVRELQITCRIQLRAEIE